MPSGGCVAGSPERGRPRWQTWAVERPLQRTWELRSGSWGVQICEALRGERNGLATASLATVGRFSIGGDHIGDAAEMIAVSQVRGACQKKGSDFVTELSGDSGGLARLKCSIYTTFDGLGQSQAASQGLSLNRAAMPRPRHEAMVSSSASSPS